MFTAANNHEITEKVRVEGASGVPLVLPPDQQGPLKQVAQDHAHLGFHHFQEWRFSNLPG